MDATDETHVNEEPDDQHDINNPLAQPRAEQFDALVRDLYPKIRHLSPHLSAIEALRAATRMAEYRMDDEGTLMWGSASTAASPYPDLGSKSDITSTP